MDRRRTAERPAQFSLQAWRDIFYRVYDEIGKDEVSILAGGVAFFALFAVIPGVVALMSIYGLVAEPRDVQNQIEAVVSIVPPSARRLVRDQASEALLRSPDSLSITAVAGVLVSIWSVNKAMIALLSAINVAYNETKQRSFIRQYIVGLLWTLVALTAAAVAIALVVALPIVLDIIGLSHVSELIVSLVRWPVLFGLVLAGLAVLYRYGPVRKPAQWRWVLWGAGFATFLWILGSVGLSAYVSNFGDYDKVYGSLGAVIVLLLWFYLTAYVIILGAELNSEMEHQTCYDTTTGRFRPMGERGAYVADHLGEPHT